MKKSEKQLMEERFGHDTAFAGWYDNGHINENDKNTCVLCIRLTDGVLYHGGKRYDIDFCGKDV